MAMGEGVTKGADEKFCESCGAAIKTLAEVCPKCGVRQRPGGPAQPKKWSTALLLCLLPGLIGICGLQRIYTGNVLMGILQLFTLGGLGIWQLIDLILILANAYRDGNGEHLAK